MPFEPELIGSVCLRPFEEPFLALKVVPYLKNSTFFFIQIPNTFLHYEE